MILFTVAFTIYVVVFIIHCAFSKNQKNASIYTIFGNNIKLKRPPDTAKPKIVICDYRGQSNNGSRILQKDLTAAYI